MTKKVQALNQNRNNKLPSFSKVEDSEQTMLMLKEIGSRAAKIAVDNIKKAGLPRVYLDEGASKLGLRRTYRKVSKIIKVSPSNEIVSVIARKPRTHYFVKCIAPVPLNINGNVKSSTAFKKQLKFGESRESAIQVKPTKLKTIRKPSTASLKPLTINGRLRELKISKTAIHSKTAKRLWVYIKTNKLEVVNTKRMINASSELKPASKVKPKVSDINVSTRRK
jgi:SWIB/MDM2 domain